MLSNWNGQVAGASAAQAMLEIAATGANSIEITPRIWTSSKTASTVFADPAKTESDASLRLRPLSPTHRPPVRAASVEPR